MKLTNRESLLIGQWVFKNGIAQKVATAERIEWLVNNHLKKIAFDAAGWDVLYINPDDNKFWELTYPQSEMQGGGPPTLICISNEEAKNKYSVGV